MSRPNREAAGKGGVARDIVSCEESAAREDEATVHSIAGDSEPPVQMWSPIREISTCRPHVEHFTVGIKRDSLPSAAMAGCGCGPRCRAFFSQLCDVVMSVPGGAGMGGR